MLQTTYMYYGYDSWAFFFEKLKIFKTSRPKIYVQCTMINDETTQTVINQLSVSFILFKYFTASTIFFKISKDNQFSI